MEQLGFFSREDPRSLEWMSELFTPKEGLVWFVESTESNKWITIYDNCSDESCLTNNPDETRQFETQMRAITYIIQNKLCNKFIPTEHEFVPSDGKEN